MTTCRPWGTLTNMAVALSASVSVFLDDLRRSGVTDAMADVPYDWFAKVEPAPAAPAASQVAPKTAQITQLKPAAAPAKTAEKQADAPVNVADWLALQAEAGSLLMVVPDEALSGGKAALSTYENELLCKIIRAAGLENIPLGWLCLQHDAADAAPLAPAVQQQLSAAVVAAVQKAAPCGVVLLGGAAVRSIFGRGVVMDEARKQALALPQGLENTPLQASYHPGALLQDPLLKRDVWQDWLSLAAKLTAAQSIKI